MSRRLKTVMDIRELVRMGEGDDEQLRKWYRRLDPILNEEDDTQDTVPYECPVS